MNRYWCSQTIRLLRKDLSPQVKIGKSSVAGSGVFAAKTVKAGDALCLYGGIYTPAPPAIDAAGDTFMTIFHDDDLSSNEYILNTTSVGGYIDGAPLKQEIDMSGKNDYSYASGYLVNHPPDGSPPNAVVLSFRWWDVFVGIDKRSDWDLYPIPNQRRSDGTPWYLCPSTGEIISHPPPSERDGGDLGAIMTDTGSLYSSMSASLAGALVIAAHELQEGEEIFFDYALRPPFPPWAREWFQPADETITYNFASIPSIADKT